MQNQFSHIIHMLKIAVKLVVSILYNGYKLIRFRSISFPFYIKKGLEVHKPSMIKLGRNVTIGRYARLACYGNSDTSLLTIEDNVYIGQYFTALVGGEISIGKNTLIASFVAIVGENHGMDPEYGLLYGKQPLIEKSVKIGENCWIGEKVIILPGVTIGDWAIIGAASVVTSDIPPYSMAVGNPAKLIKTYNFKTHRWEKIK